MAIEEKNIEYYKERADHFEKEFDTANKEIIFLKRQQSHSAQQSAGIKGKLEMFIEESAKDYAYLKAGSKLIAADYIKIYENAIYLFNKYLDETQSSTQERVTSDLAILSEKLKLFIVKESARELFYIHNKKWPDPEVYIEDRILRGFEKDIQHILPFIYDKLQSQKENITERVSERSDLEFAKWLEENTIVVKEEKITLYRYCDKMNEWGNYTLDDIYTEYRENILREPVSLQSQPENIDDNPFIKSLYSAVDAHNKFYKKENISEGLSEKFTKEEVVKIIEEILEYPDVLIDACTNENTDVWGKDLFELGTKVLKK